MNIRRSDGTLEEYSVDTVKRGIVNAYLSVEEDINELIIDSVIENIYVYEGIASREIRRQVENALMGINKKVARAYFEMFDAKDIENKRKKKHNDFIHAYIAAKNAATGSKFDSNANVSKKNVVTMGQELYKKDNIEQNRYILYDRIKSLYSKKLADRYIYDLETHRLYKHDETAIPGMPYTYSAKEVIEVEYKGRHLMLPFDLLWDVIDEDAVLVNEADNVYQKKTDYLFVKDRNNQYTKVSVITKKERKRDLVRVKTAFGEDVVVTDNHPMIVNIDDVNDCVDAINSNGCKQYKINDKIVFDGNTVIDLCGCPNIEHYTDVYCMTYSHDSFKRHLTLDEKFGYFVGFFVGDGNYNNNKNNGSIVITQKNRETLEKLNNILFECLGITGIIRYKRDKFNCYSLTVSNDVLWWILDDIFMIQDKAENKTLPINILETNEDFAKGVLSGLIDSDGTVNDCQLSIRLSSRSAIIQTTNLLRHFGYGVGNTIQRLPFSNNTSYKTNYTLWGVNTSVRTDSVKFGMCEKLKNVRISDSALKYHKDGETNITSVEVINENDSFLDLNDFIYDITTETRTFACNNLLVHNCVAVTLYPFLTDGLTQLGGPSRAPKSLKSFCGEFINLVYSISSQFAGAVATPEFLMYMDYFIRKDYGQNYLEKLDTIVELTEKPHTLEHVIENYFQQVVHSMNMPAGNRGYQSVFWNVGYFDYGYFKGVFGDFRFPDGSEPKWETLSWLQKKFMKWFNSEREKYVLTFPVETMACLTDGHDLVDEDYADFTAQMWADGHSFFTYLSDSPDSLSSCCRLRNSLKDVEDDEHNHTTHQFSMGTASVATGSKSVMTMNLNRIIQNSVVEFFDEHKDIDTDYVFGEKYDLCNSQYKEQIIEKIKSNITEFTENIHKYQTAFNSIVKDFFEANMLDVYSAGFINLRKQYLTIGVNGLTDAAEFLNITVGDNADYQNFVNIILETINISNSADKTRDCMFNTEFVPGENLSNKNYNWDKADGYYVSNDHIMYSSYFFNPEDDMLSVLKKMKLHGTDYVQYLDGGSACHINLKEHLSKEQYRNLLKYAASVGCNYFTFNVRNTVCNDCGYISKHDIDECPHCHSTNVDKLTRIIGYLKRVSSFAEPRQIEEHMRHYNETAE